MQRWLPAATAYRHRGFRLVAIIRARSISPTEWRILEVLLTSLAREGRLPAQLSREFGVTAQSITTWSGRTYLKRGSDQYPRFNNRVNLLFANCATFNTTSGGYLDQLHAFKCME